MCCAQALSDLSKSVQIVPTSVEFVDIAGLVKGASKGEGLGNQFLANIRECDAIAQVQINHRVSVTDQQCMLMMGLDCLGNQFLANIRECDAIAQVQIDTQGLCVTPTVRADNGPKVQEQRIEGLLPTTALEELSILCPGLGVHDSGVLHCHSGMPCALLQVIKCASLTCEPCLMHCV